jgi:hypothetical protein
MIKSITTKTSLLLVIITLNSSLYAIQDSTANMCTAFVAALCAGCSYKIIHDMPGKVHPFVLVGMSSLITATVYYGAHQSTPAGRIKRANLLLNDLSRHTFVRTHFDNDQAFFDAVQDVYLTDDLPLISAYNHLIDFIPTVHYAFGLINKATAEVRKNVLLQEECDASLSCANKLFRNISDAIKRIREHKDYLSQLSIYKESLLQEQQTIAQQQMASAHQDIAQAKQGSALLKWLKFLFGYRK